MSKKIINELKRNIAIFSDFKDVYLFGSAMNKTDYYDIDLLIIYETFPQESKRTHLADKLSQLLGSPVDITFLSIKEEKELKFLERIEGKYLHIKQS